MLYAPEADWRPDTARGFNVGFDLGAGDLPPDMGFRREVYGTVKGKLTAWDPVARQARWTVEFPGPWNGGILATGGGLRLEAEAPGVSVRLIGSELHRRAGLTADGVKP